MKCNICGGEMPDGQSVCKYCGNIMPEVRKKDEPIVTPQNINEQRINYTRNIKPDVEVCQQRRANGGYCVKCGRPLDGVTNKCIVCDAAQVSQRAYTNEDYKKMEMNKMAQKKKKKKKNNSIRNVLLAVIGMIIIFFVALWFAFNKLPGWLGIGVQEETATPEITVTTKPKKTTDPNWKPTDNDPDETESPDFTQTPLPTKAPVRTPVPVETGDPVETRGGEYEYPSDTKLITEQELKEKKREEIKYIYWEIYARHGYTFDDAGLSDYFEQNHDEWYIPTISDEEKVKANFNDIEKKNIEVIEAYQKKMGWRQ